jgi:hypothetical protein
VRLAWRGCLTVAGLAACATFGAAYAAKRISDATPAPAGATLKHCGDCPGMIVVPAGEFVMGAPEDEAGRFPEEGPQRTVRIRRFALGRFDVTRAQWAAFVAATHRPARGGCAWSDLPGGPDGKPNPAASWRDLGFPQSGNHPVVCVSWEDARDYAHWLARRTGHRYRLPSEAEWEYAARAGTPGPYPWGAQASHAHANYGADTCCSGAVAGRDRWTHTSPVDAFPPNALGLHDMHGKRDAVGAGLLLAHVRGTRVRRQRLRQQRAAARDRRPRGHRRQARLRVARAARRKLGRPAGAPALRGAQLRPAARVAEPRVSQRGRGVSRGDGPRLIGLRATLRQTMRGVTANRSPAMSTS